MLRGRIFSQAGNHLAPSSFLAKNELINDRPLYLVPSWERARSQLTKNAVLKSVLQVCFSFVFWLLLLSLSVYKKNNAYKKNGQA